MSTTTALKPCAKTEWEVSATRWSRADIPAAWQLKGVLARDCGLCEPERFAFYAMPDGRVAEVQFHPMNGWEDLFARVGSAASQRDRWNELLAGEPWEQRTDIGYGRIDHRQGKMRKARRVA
jgi:hypothetical protein